MNHLKNTYYGFAFSSLLLIAPTLQAETLTLKLAETLALKNEPSLMSQNFMAHSMLEKSIADSQLMDPKIRIGLNNLPTNSFNFNQEAMTQLKVSYIQKFPSGDTLSLKEQKALTMRKRFLAQLSDRQRTILQQVRLIFLDIYYWEQAKITVQKNKLLLTQLVDIVQSLFSVGRHKQQDLIAAQLGLSRLDDRFAKIEQKLSIKRAKLSRWLGKSAAQFDIQLQTPELPEANINNDFNTLSKLFLKHPKVQQLDHKIQIARKEIQIIEESLKSGWDLNVSYGYRGNDRTDFISVAATFDLPLLNEKRQNKQRLSKEYEYQALKNKRLALIKQLVAQAQQDINNKNLLLKRQLLYKNLLLPQAKQQSEVAITSYQSDRASFSEVMQAYMDDLNANLDHKRLEIETLKAQANILYLTESLDS